MKLTILRGISGSGKSTWARNQNAAVVCRDDLRVGLFGSDGPEYYAHPDLKAREELVSKVEALAIAEHLSAGRDVISDNTNIEPKYAQKIADIGYRLGAEVEVKVFDVRLAVAIAANKHRAAAGGRDVPESAIRRQHDRLAGTKDWNPTPIYIPKPYNGTPGKPKAILVDIDGTLAHMNNKRGPFDWKKVGVDDPDINVMQIIDWIKRGMEEDAYVILMSGRDEVCRDETVNWLWDWGFDTWDKLYMRPQGDNRKDSIIKAELFDKYIRDNYDVVAVFDDRNQVVDMWRAMGLKVLQVAEGDF